MNKEATFWRSGDDRDMAGPLTNDNNLAADAEFEQILDDAACANRPNFEKSQLGSQAICGPDNLESNGQERGRNRGIDLNGDDE